MRCAWRVSAASRHRAYCIIPTVGASIAVMIPGAAGRVRHDLFDESQGKLLGQCADGKLLQQLEERTRLPRGFRNAHRSETGRVRIYRDILQPETPPLRVRLPQSGAASCCLDCRAKAGGLRASLVSEYASKLRFPNKKENQYHAQYLPMVTDFFGIAT